MKITVLDLSHLVLGGKKYFEIIYDENEDARVWIRLIGNFVLLIGKLKVLATPMEEMFTRSGR